MCSYICKWYRWLFILKTKRVHSWRLFRIATKRNECGCANVRGGMVDEDKQTIQNEKTSIVPSSECVR